MPREITTTGFDTGFEETPPVLAMGTLQTLEHLREVALIQLIPTRMTHKLPDGTVLIVERDGLLFKIFYRDDEDQKCRLTARAHFIGNEIRFDLIKTEVEPTDLPSLGGQKLMKITGREPGLSLKVILERLEQPQDAVDDGNQGHDGLQPIEAQAEQGNGTDGDEIQTEQDLADTDDVEIHGRSPFWDEYIDVE